MHQDVDRCHADTDKLHCSYRVILLSDRQKRENCRWAVKQESERQESIVDEVGLADGPHIVDKLYDTSILEKDEVVWCDKSFEELL